MVVELHDTVVANVAVAAPSGPENVARLAELEFEQERRVSLVHLQVEDARLSTHVCVLLMNLVLGADPGAGGDDSRLTRGSMHHEEVRHQEQEPEQAEQHFPLN